jgi:uncharacterized protein DUF2325
MKQNQRQNTTDVVARVRTLLRDQSVLIIGGDRRRFHIDRLIKAFELNDLYWLETRESDPHGSGIRSTIGRPSIALVVVLIGLVRHAHANTATRLCRELETPIVRYRSRSPHPHGLAIAIQEQVSERLQRSRAYRERKVSQLKKGDS